MKHTYKYEYVIYKIKNLYKVKLATKVWSSFPFSHMICTIGFAMGYLSFRKINTEKHDLSHRLHLMLNRVILITPIQIQNLRRFNYVSNAP